jgi:DNA-binding CsgD family transcriptional regulator
MAQPLRSFAAQPLFRFPARGRFASPSGDFASASFESHPDAQFVIRSDGEVLGTNAAGRRMMSTTAGAAALAGQLPQSATPKLRTLLDEIQAAIRAQQATGTLELALSPRDLYSMRVVPLGPTLDAALLIVQPRELRVVARARERFGFTAAESLVAERLARGLTVPEIALQLGVSIETVRCHLKQAFAKAGVHRQAELVAVMLGG